MISRFSVGALVLVAISASPAAAANKEHQQLMADLRILQQQTQLLQNLLGQFNEQLKVVTARLDQQTETNRKAFADQKLAIDNLTNDARVLREKLDDNNVRVGSLSQEVDALRQSLQQMAGGVTRPSIAEPTETGGGAAPSPGGAPPAGGSAAAAPSLTASPKQMYEAAFADYTAGQYDLAVLGFEAYIKTFPKSDLADNAQALICASYLADRKYDKAVEACDTAIRLYPNGDAVPDAYFRKGLALADLKDMNGARAAWETVVKNYPDSDAGRLAKQRLEQIRRPD